MIRACIVQSIVAHYRRGVFNRVADEADIDLTAIAQVTVPKDGRKPIAQADAYRIIPGKQRSFGPFISRPSVMDAVRGDYDVVILPWHPRTLELPKALRHARKRGLPVAPVGSRIQQARDMAQDMESQSNCSACRGGSFSTIRSTPNE